MVKVWDGGLFGIGRFCLCPRPGSGYLACPSTFACSPLGRNTQAGLAEPDPFFVLGKYSKHVSEGSHAVGSSFVFYWHQGHFLGFAS